MMVSACSQYQSMAAHASANDVVREHGELVRRIAYHLVGRLPSSVDVGDLIQAGMIGLIEAARQFRSGQGAVFSTYASIRIRGAMIDEIRKLDWMPRSVHRRMREAAETLRRIEQKKGKPATASEVASAMHMTIDEYQQLLQNSAAGHVLSLEAETERVGELGISDDHPNPEHDLEQQDFKRELISAIQDLPEREKMVLSLYYEQELNLKEIGAVLGVSESRVSQLHGQAMLRLRQQLADWSMSDAVS